MQPAGMQQQAPRFQTQIRTIRPVNQAIQNQAVRAARPRAPITRPRGATLNIRPTTSVGQQIITTTSQMVNRPRVTLTRLTGPNHIQPIISVGTPKTVVSITTPPRGPNIVRAQMPVYNKTPQTQQTHIQNSPSTSNSSALTEDLEDSIQAARITKQSTTIQTSDGNYTIVQQNAPIQQISDDNRIVTLQTGTQMSVTEYKQRVASQPKQIAGIKPINRTVVQNRQTRFVSPNMVRAQRPVMVSSHILKNS